MPARSRLHRHRPDAPDTKTGALKNVSYVLKGRTRMRCGKALECVMARSDTEALGVNPDIGPEEKPRSVLWIDPIRTAP